MSHTPTDPRLSRRAFIRTSAAVTAGLAIPGRHLAAGLSVPTHAYAAGSDTLRVGLVGCGGRGTGAAVQNLRSAPGIELVAMGDLVPDRLARSRERIAAAVAEEPALAEAVRVTDDTCFTGFDAYRRVLETDVDLVILATPPAFRPLHLAAAIEADKHVFAEKPVATDVAGCLSCLETYENALQRGLAIGVGTQRRHHSGYQEVMNRIGDGAMGEVLGGQVYWNQGGLWSEEPRPEWSDTEWQIRNWLYFAWTAGDHIVEQHIHNLDVANWVMGGRHPIRAIGVGGRQARTDPVYGHIYDHFAVDFEYPDGVHVMSMCRQMNGTRGRNGEFFQGTRGQARTSENGPYRITGPGAYEWERPDDWVLHMVQEHADLVESIRQGRPLNDLRRMTESVLTAIMGREAAYTGQIVEWDELLEAEQNIAPAHLENLRFGPLDVPPVPMPGRTRIDRTFLEGW